MYYFILIIKIYTEKKTLKKRNDVSLPSLFNEEV